MLNTKPLLLLFNGALLLILATGCQTKVQDYGSVTGSDQASLYREDPKLYEAEAEVSDSQTAAENK